MHAHHGREEDATSLFASFRRASSEPPNQFLLASALRGFRAVSLGEQATAMLYVTSQAPLSPIVVRARLAGNHFVIDRRKALDGMDVKQHLISKKSAKEAWETIKMLNLGYERVREAALQTLQKKYENLEMGEDETLDAFASRVATLVNGIRALDVKCFLRAAPPRYLSVVSAIEQCVDLKTLTMDDLVGRFKAHDERMKITYGDVVPEEHVMLTRAQWQAVVAKEKGGKESNRSDKEVSRLAKKYIAGEDEDDAPPRRKFDIKKVRCHNCDEFGHFKVDCRKPPKPKERAIIAQEGDDGPMMLMLEVCELKDEEELPPPSPAREIVMDHGLPCVDHVDKLCDEGVVEKQRLQDSINPKPLKVGIAEEYPRQLAPSVGSLGIGSFGHAISGFIIITGGIVGPFITKFGELDSIRVIRIHAA
ncbi:hypothetical protein QYE76_059037 [Lolium multiflorum]|uniref:CCHC-type domain-containing protein n=1 Tax=Lolium multiflorum TaxID=4521 RepID=A0AAD8T881_LOLMU|nr:hypothetical protein QYE76_059037 [Lolium multiflorum]